MLTISWQNERLLVIDCFQRNGLQKDNKSHLLVVICYAMKFKIEQILLGTTRQNSISAPTPLDTVEVWGRLPNCSFANAFSLPILNKEVCKASG